MVCRKGGGFCGRYALTCISWVMDLRGVRPSFVDNVIRQYKGSHIESF